MRGSLCWAQARRAVRGPKDLPLAARGTEEPRTGAALPSGVQMGKRSAQHEGILSQLPVLEEPDRAEVLSAF